MSEINIQFIAILASLVGLFGWTIKVIITYFIKSKNEKEQYIERLVESNQKNTENFTNTINHQRTLDREMQQNNTKMIIESITGMKNEMVTTNKINNELMNFLREIKLKGE